MKKETIIIIQTASFNNCEMCGSTTEYSTIVKYGDWSYGKAAFAHCYNSEYTEPEEAYCALLDHLGLDKPEDTSGRGYLLDSDYLAYFKQLGYELEIEEAEDPELDYDDYLYDDYDDED